MKSTKKHQWTMPSGAKANAGERRDPVRNSLDILNYQDQTVSVSVYSNHQTRSQKAAGAITESIIKVAMIVTSTTVRDLNHQNVQMYWGSTTYVPISNEQRLGSQIERPKSPTKMMLLPIGQMNSWNFIRRNGDLPKKAAKSKEVKSPSNATARTNLIP